MAESDQFAKSIEQAAANKGVNINAAITEENIKKLSGDAVVQSSFTGKILDVRGIRQERDVLLETSASIPKYITN